MKLEKPHIPLDYLRSLLRELSGVLEDILRARAAGFVSAVRGLLQQTGPALMGAEETSRDRLDAKLGHPHSVWWLVGLILVPPILAGWLSRRSVQHRIDSHMRRIDQNGLPRRQ